MKSKFIQMIPKFVLALTLIVAFTSCSKDSVESQVLDNTKSSLYEVIEAQASDSNVNYKNAPGDDAIALIAINGGFGELVDALVYVDEELNAGLVDLFLNGTDQFTVFAPTDNAFMELYAALSTEETTITDISQLPAELVLNVLLYHVTDGRRAAKSVVPKKKMKTIET